MIRFLRFCLATPARGTSMAEVACVNPLGRTIFSSFTSAPCDITWNLRLQRSVNEPEERLNAFEHRDRRGQDDQAEEGRFRGEMGALRD